MDTTLLGTFGILSFLCIVVAIDELLEKKPTILGEEWDFTKINFKPK